MAEFCTRLHTECAATRDERDKLQDEVDSLANDRDRLITTLTDLAREMEKIGEERMAPDTASSNARGATWFAAAAKVRMAVDGREILNPVRPKPVGGPCPCECNSGGFCGGCGHAGCGGRR